MYENVCWKCGAQISARNNQKCLVCDWFICDDCGACKENECFSIALKVFPEWRFNHVVSRYCFSRLRNIYFSLPASERAVGDRFDTWVIEAAKKLKKDDQQQEEAEKEERLRKEQEKNKPYFDKYYPALKKRQRIYHDVFGEGITSQLTKIGYYDFRVRVSFAERNADISLDDFMKHCKIL